MRMSIKKVIVIPFDQYLSLCPEKNTKNSEINLDLGVNSSKNDSKHTLQGSGFPLEEQTSNTSPGIKADILKQDNVEKNSSESREKLSEDGKLETNQDFEQGYPPPPGIPEKKILKSNEHKIIFYPDYWVL